MAHPSRKPMGLLAMAAFLAASSPVRAGDPFAAPADDEVGGPARLAQDPADSLVPCEPVEAPAPSAPYGSITISGARPTFQWEPIHVTNQPPFAVLVQNGDDAGAILAQASNVNGLSWTSNVDLPTDKLLRWKVKVDGPCGVGRYSLLAYFYIRTAASPTVSITGPTQGSTVGESATVQATVSGTVQSVEFYVDGVYKAVDSAAPYQYTWDTTVNPLPVIEPPRDIHTGYYFAEYKDVDTFDARRAEVNGYTDTYIASFSTYISDFPWLWIPNLAASLDDAVYERKWVHLGVDLHSPDYAPYFEQVMETARTRWANILRIEVAHESEASVTQMQAWTEQVRTWILDHHLPMPPQGLGATATYTQPIPDWKNAAGLDWIGLEAYLVPPGGGSNLETVEQLLRQLGPARNQVPATKKILLIPMAYNRNGTWLDYVKLRDVQLSSYVAALVDPRVIAIDPFAYTRLGGTRDIPDLKTPHRVMSERILRVPYPGAANGPHSLHVKAVAADGKYANARVGVYVANRLFYDMDVNHGARTSVEAVWNAGISEQCGADSLGRSIFCPDLPNQRRLVARWLVKAKSGILYRPPAATGVYTDVLAEDAPWVEEAVRRNILQPSGPGTFNPNGSVTRAEMSVCVLKAYEGPTYVAPACTMSAFSDVACASTFGPWVNELYRRNITTGCMPNLFCPNDIVSRWMMSVFVDRAF